MLSVAKQVVVEKDKEERRLSKVKISIMRNPQFAFWSGVMMLGRTRVVDDLPTAATNGRDEMYGREFIKELDDKELAFVVLHETMHKVYRHLFIWRKLYDEDAQLANMACDYVINLELVDMDKNNSVIAMPVKNGKRIGLLDEQFRGMNSKQVFDLLKQEKKDGKGRFGAGDGEGEGAGGFDEHDWKGAKELTDKEKSELERDVDAGIRQGLIAQQKIAGKGAGGMSRELGDLLAPQVNWKEALREFVKSTMRGGDTSSWRRVNRRFLHTGVYMPTLISERVGHLVVGIDTSGSIGGQELNDFLAEVQGIAQDVKPEKIDLLYWDCEVAGHEEYDTNALDNIVTSTQPKGGGGTDPSCMIGYMQEKAIRPDAIIILTDGYIGDSWGVEWNAPVLWVVIDNDVIAPVGKTIHIKRGE
jgi:predicted metal-dependent peptidase